jgi:hypothetical protein
MDPTTAPATAGSARLPSSSSSSSSSDISDGGTGRKKRQRSTTTSSSSSARVPTNDNNSSNQWYLWFRLSYPPGTVLTNSYSLIIDNELHSFLTGDRGHTRTHLPPLPHLSTTSMLANNSLSAVPLLMAEFLDCRRIYRPITVHVPPSSLPSKMT